MKKLLIIMITLALIAGVSVNEAKAADIAVTVTMQAVAVSLDESAWVIGPIALGGTAQLLAIVATNDGNVSENLLISVDDTGTTWSAGSASGSEVFRMEFGLGAIPTFPGTLITTSAGSLVSGVAAPGSQEFGLQFTAPSGTGVGIASQSITVTVSASAA